MKRKYGKWVSWTLLIAMALGVYPYVPASAEGLDYAKVPKLLITELVPDTNNVSGSDGYEFIEVYNNTSAGLDFRDFKLVYTNGNTNTDWALIAPVKDEPVPPTLIPPGQSIALWVINSANGGETAANFNANFMNANVTYNLEEGKNLFRVNGGGGMANTGTRSLTIKDNGGIDIVKVAYTVATSKVNYGIVYNYPTDGSISMQLAGLETDPATPGIVAPTQVPDHPSDYVPGALGFAHTPPAKAWTNQDLNISAVVSGGVNTVTAELYYKSDVQADFASVAMTPGADNIFTAVVPQQALVGANQLQYYFRAADGAAEPIDSPKYNIIVETPNLPPIIDHIPVTKASKNSDIVLTAAISNAEPAAQDPVTATVYYKTSSQQFFSAVAMKLSGTAYQATISKDALAEPLLQYYIEAKDKSNTVKTDTYDVTVDVSLDPSKLPPLLITELLPDSVNVKSSDDGEFIEVYNNSDKPISFKDYKVYYRYPDSGTEADVIWPADKDDIVIDPGKTLVFWVINSGNATQTVSDFNAAFKTNLVENKDIVKVRSDGMANSAKRGVAIGTNTHEDIVAAYYDGAVKGEVVAGKGILYKYPSNGSNTMLKYSAGTQNATPGSVDAEQIPSAPVQTPDDTAEPTIGDHTGKTSVGAGDKLDLIADVKDDIRVLSVAVYYKADKDADYTKRYLTANFNDTMYHQLLTQPDLIGKKYIDYYFEASDGTHLATTQVKRVTVDDGQNHDPLRLNVKDGDIVSGTKVLKGTAESAGPDTLQLKIDGVTAGDVYYALEKDAFFAFDAKEVDYYFKNAITIGQEILYTFMDPIPTYATLSYPIASARLKAGENAITIRAGTKTGPFDERPEENKDDFVVRNVRLVLSDGTVIMDPLYANALKELKIGDSGDKPRFIDFKFALPAERLRSRTIDWNTASLTDGEHTVEVVGAGNSTVTAKVIVDNTAPSIEASVEDGQTYRGSFKLDAKITDALAGVASSSATLDGKEIAMPYAAFSGALAAGEHVLVVKAEDKAGNVSEKMIRFSVPDENPEQPKLIAPLNGSKQAKSSVKLEVQVNDPSNDVMKVGFYKGFKYDSHSLKGFAGYAGQSEVEPPKQLQLDDEKALSAEDYEKIGAADGNYLVNDSDTQFPYHRFTIKLDASVKATDRVDIAWQGKSLEGRKVSLYAWQPASNKWVMLDTRVADAADFSLTATVKAGDYNTNGTIQAMVQDELPVKQDPYDFSFIWMSDTQYYAASYPWIYEGNTKWIADHKQDMNIKYVIHTGDIVDNAEQEYQWINADKAMKTLEDAEIPYGVLAGNHDVSHQNGDYTNYYKHYGEDRVKGQPTFGESYKNNRGHYDLVSAGGVDFIVVYMGWGVTSEDIDWVNQVVSEHPDRKAILCFHEYMLVSNNRAPIAEKIFERVVKPNKNVIMALSGHYHDSQTLIDKIDDDGDGTPDREVYQMLADYQGAPEGGLGYIRLMQFDIKNNQVHMKSYSPYLDDYNYYDPAQFPNKDEYDMNVDLNAMKKRVATDYFGVRVYTDQRIGTASNVQSGQTVSATWSGLAPDRYYEWYVQTEDNYSGNTLSDIWGFATGTVLPETPDPGTSNPGASDPGDKPSTGSGSQKDVVLNVQEKDGVYPVGIDELKKAVSEAASATGIIDLRLGAASAEAGQPLTIKLSGEGFKKARQSGTTFRVVTAEGTLVIPASAVPGDAAEGSDEILLTIQVKDNRSEAGQSASPANGDGALRTTGLTFEFSLTSVRGQTKTDVHRLEKPVTVRRTLSAERLAGIDPDYAGVYYMNGSKAEYVGGTVAGGELVFTVDHFSTFALLEYRKAFSDMKGNWAEEYVNKLAAKHIVTGVDENRFAPKLAVTRADFAVLAVRALGYGVTQPLQGHSNFADVPSKAYYAGYVSKASELGLIQGDGKRFRPTDNISREEAVLILVRAYGAMTHSVVALQADAASFADMDQASAWAREAIATGQSLGLISGKSGNLFDPRGQVTRAEIAKMIYQLLHVKV
ncbi:S-layer homology domain-containing protein [Cohnella soli]|uniref:S-layer homology domain-containing protein n=1 Tax=Cohnella soli TaxID=425005 RepID=A0ABW0HNL9_9BACL